MKFGVELPFGKQSSSLQRLYFFKVHSLLCKLIFISSWWNPVTKVPETSKSLIFGMKCISFKTSPPSSIKRSEFKYMCSLYANIEVRVLIPVRDLKVPLWNKFIPGISTHSSFGFCSKKTRESLLTSLKYFFFMETPNWSTIVLAQE